MKLAPNGILFSVPKNRADFLKPDWDALECPMWNFSLLWMNRSFSMRSPDGDAHAFDDESLVARVADHDDDDPDALADEIYRRFMAIAGQPMPLWVAETLRKRLLDWIVKSRVAATDSGGV